MEGLSFEPPRPAKIAAARLRDVGKFKFERSPLSLLGHPMGMREA
jgi:hypothetical protein